MIVSITKIVYCKTIYKLQAFVGQINVYALRFCQGGEFIFHSDTCFVRVKVFYFPWSDHFVFGIVLFKSSLWMFTQNLKKNKISPMWELF